MMHGRVISVDCWKRRLRGRPMGPAVDPNGSEARLHDLQQRFARVRFGQQRQAWWKSALMCAGTFLATVLLGLWLTS